MRMKNIAVMLVLGCLATSAMAGEYTVVGDLTVASNATLNTVTVQNGVVIEGDTLLQNSRLGMRNLSSNGFAFVSNVGTGDVSVLNIADAMFVGESSNVVIGTVLTNGEEKLQVVGNVKADFFIGDGSRLTNVVIGGAISAAGRGTRTAATLASIFDEAGLDGADAEVLIDGGVWNVDADLVVPENVILNIRPGSMLNIASGRTLVVNGTVIDGMTQKFGGAGSVAGLGFVRPEWFGAKANDEYADADAINKAIKSGTEITLSAGVYLLDKEVNPASETTLKGVRGATELRVMSDISRFHSGTHQIWAISFYGGSGTAVNNCLIEGLVVDANLDAFNSSYPDISAACVNLYGQGITIRDCDFYGWGCGTTANAEENFVVQLYPNFTTSKKNNIITGCSFHDPSILPRISGIGGGVIVVNTGWSSPQCGSSNVGCNYWKWSQDCAVTDTKGIVENCTFYNIKNRTGSCMTNNVLAFLRCVGANIVRGNRMHDCLGVGFMGSDTGNFDPLIVEDNVIDNCDVFFYTSYQVWSAKFKNVSIRNNVAGITPQPSGYIAPMFFMTFDVLYSNTTYETFTNYTRYPIIENMDIIGNTFSRAVGTEGMPYSDYLSGINFWLNTNMGYNAGNQLFKNINIANNLFDGDVRICRYYNDEKMLNDYVMDGLHCYNNRSLDFVDEPAVFYGSGANGFGTKRFPVTAAVFSASELAEIQSPESLFGSDGGMGNIDIVRPITGYGRVEYSADTNIVFSGRQSLKITVTNSEHGTVTARLHSSNHIISPARDAAYTMGAWFYPLVTNTTLQVGYLANTTFADGYSRAYTHVVGAEDTGKWINVSCTFKPITAGINTVDLYFGFLPSSYPEAGDAVYVDSVYLVRGMLPRNQAVSVGEIYSGENATHLTPLFIGEDVYNATDGKWYKAKGLTTNDWVQL